MARRRFMADRWTATTATLTGDQADHLARVLRAVPGQVYDVVAGGFAHRAEIIAVRPGDVPEVEFALYDKLESETSLPLHLLLAVFKFDHMEWAIEKATELGVARITPVLARRTEKHLAEAATKRVERWRRIALEAAKQSRRTCIPEISNPAPLKQALAAETSETKILLSEVEQSTPLAQALASHPSGTVALAIGPEGGWTSDELALFPGHGWQPVTLGPRILRAETAAIAAIAIASSVLS